MVSPLVWCSAPTPRMNPCPSARPGEGERFKDPYIHIMDHGEFPRALVTMKVKDGLSVLDGSHRLAAFDMLGGPPTRSLPSLARPRLRSNRSCGSGRTALAKCRLLGGRSAVASKRATACAGAVVDV
jgi:hypothetical protein